MLAALVTTMVAAQAPSAPTPAPLPGPSAAQPLPFSHKRHVAMDLECKTCHEMPEPGKAMTLPPTATCMPCHDVSQASPAIQKLAAYNANGQKVPWKRVYYAPSYVFFSHKTHVTNGKVGCDACHGPVHDMDVIVKKANDISMQACMDCHEKKEAPAGCSACHEPL